MKLENLCGRLLPAGTLFLLTVLVRPAWTADSVERAQRAINRRQYVTAIRLFSRAAEKEPSAKNYYLLGDAHIQRGFWHRGPETASKSDAKAAIKALRNALNLDRGLSDVPQQRFYEDLALAYEAIGSMAEATWSYRKAVRADPNDPIPPLYAARMRYRKGDKRGAKTNLNLSLMRAEQSGRQSEIRSLIEHNPVFQMLKDILPKIN